MTNIPQNMPERALEPIKIDQGFRAWYHSCPCCLSESYPEVKQALDAEKGMRAAEQAAESGESS